MQYIASLDGTTLAVADGTLPSPRAHVVIVHGYAEHSGRYDELVRILEENDFAAHRFDLRGHGHSGGVRAHIGRFDEYIDDMRAVLGHVNERRHDTSPLFVLGHSLGGLISLEYCRRSPEAIRGVVVSSPFLHPAFEVLAAKRFLAKGASIVAPALRFDNTLEPEWLSTDEEIVQEYQADPLVQRTTTPRWFIEVEAAQKMLVRRAPEVTTPLLMLLGEDDKVADHTLARTVFDRLGSADKDLQIYAGLRHEVFNERNRHRVFRDVVGWLKRRSDESLMNHPG